MLDQISKADTARDLVIRVHARMPADWPSARDAGLARCHVFQTREFIGVWAETYGASDAIAPYFVEVADQCERRLMFVPLCIARRGGEKVLSFIDQGSADYNAPVLYPNAVRWTPGKAQQLWEAILAALPPVDLVVLDKIPAQVDGQANPLFFVAGEANGESAHGSNLTLPWDQIEATQAQLKTIRRKWRALERLGPVSFHMAETDTEIARVLQRAIAQKQRRFDDTKIAGFDRDVEKLAFFERATKVFADAGQLQLCALKVGDEIVATAWGLALGQRVYEIMIGYEAGDWAKYSCGRILNIMQMRWLKDNGYAYLDHGIGDESWKLDYCDTHVPLGKKIQVRSERGRLLLARWRLADWLRGTGLWQALRPWKWAIQKTLRSRKRGLSGRTTDA